MHTHFKTFTLLLAALPLMFSACRVIETPTQPEQKMPVRISLSVDTKVLDTTYEDGDDIGLFMSYSDDQTYVTNNRYVYGSGLWNTNNVIFWKDKTTAADFMCYHPYAEVSQANQHQFSVKTDQSRIENYKASDFTWGTTKTIKPISGDVQIGTSHIMSNVLIYLKPGAGFTPQEFATAAKTVKISNIKNNSTINLLNGTISPYGPNASIVPFDAGECYKAIIVPQSVTADANLLEVTINGVKYSSAYRMDFKSRTQHKLTVTADKYSSGLGITIENWLVDDVNHEVTIR